MINQPLAPSKVRAFWVDGHSVKLTNQTMNNKRTTSKNFCTLQELYRAEKYRSAPRLHKLMNLLYLASKYRRNVGGEDMKYMTQAFDQLIHNLHEEIDQARYVGQTLRQHGIFS